MPVDDLRFGLKKTTIESINKVLSHHNEIDKVLIYGSRAIGNYRTGSDIDLTLFGEALTYQQLNRIELELDELLLPYSIDLSLFKQIDNQALIDHINHVGKVFYKKQK